MGKIDLKPDVIPEIGQIHLLQTFSESRTDLKVEDQDRESTTRTRMSIRMMMKKRMWKKIRWRIRLRTRRKNTS